MKNLERVIKPATGEFYHVSWAEPGCMWKCVEVKQKAGWVKLKTPKSGKEIWVKIECLRKVPSYNSRNNLPPLNI
jgi:hypothetical protein